MDHRTAPDDAPTPLVAPRRSRGVPAPLAALLVAAARPLFRVHLELYRREMASSIFPRDERAPLIAGPRPERLAFIGSVAVSGLGVLSHGMTTSSQTAARVADRRGRGLSWSELTSPVLTMHTAATMPSLTTEGADVVVVLLGIADVLAATSATSWEADLRLLVDRVREEAGPEVGVVVAELPPMAEFRPIPPVARRLITAQIARLDAASRRVAADDDAVTVVPFPSWSLDGLYVQELFSWASMHRKWAEALAPGVVAALEAVDDRRAAPTRRHRAASALAGAVAAELAGPASEVGAGDPAPVRRRARRRAARAAAGALSAS